VCIPGKTHATLLEMPPHCKGCILHPVGIIWGFNLILLVWFQVGCLIAYKNCPWSWFVNCGHALAVTLTWLVVIGSVYRNGAPETMVMHTGLNVVALRGRLDGWNLLLLSHVCVSKLIVVLSNLFLK